MPDVKLSQLLATSPASVAAGAALWTHKEHIAGLRLEWISTTSLRVGSGSAFIESLGYAIPVPAAITKSSLILSASTMYHVYLFLSAGVPDVEIVTTAPATAFSGTARSKTGDTSRRYLGTLITFASGAIVNFSHAVAVGRITYLEGLNVSPFRVLTSGVATVATTVSCTGVVPPTAPIAVAQVSSTATNTTYMYLNNSDNSSPLVGAFLNYVDPNSNQYFDLALNTSQEFQYAYNVAPTGGSGFVRIAGYYYER